MRQFANSLNKLSYRHAGLLYCAFISLFYWAVYYPGILAVDSVNQYQQAVSGQYADWHPPIMAYVLSLILHLGGRLAWITLVQISAGFFGAFVLASSMSEALGLPKRHGELAAFGIIVLLSIPITPFSVYLATFWKDTWLLILLIWNLALLFMLRNREQSNHLPSYLVQLFLLIVLLAALLLVRHNAIVVYPIAAWALWHVLGRSTPGLHKFVLLLCPLFLYFGFLRFQYSILRADHAHIEYVVYQVDLVSMVVLKPSILQELPYMTEHLQGDWKNDFMISDSGYTYIYRNDLLDNLLYLDPASGSLLAQEYKHAVIRFPWTWLYVKTVMFLDHLQPYRDRYPYNDYMEHNEFGITFNTIFFPQRSTIFAIMNGVSTHPWFRWLSFVHFPWLIINCAMVTIFALLSRKGSSFDGYSSIALIIAIPLVYYLSFLIAITFASFRFMYPATTVTQIMALTTLSGFAMQNAMTKRCAEQSSTRSRLGTS